MQMAILLAAGPMCKRDCQPFAKPGPGMARWLGVGLTSQQPKASGALRSMK